MRYLWAIFLNIVILVVVGSVLWFFVFSSKISTASDVPSLAIRMVNQRDLMDFLKFRDFWDWKNEFTKNQQVRRLVVRFTDKPQLLNTEIVKEKIIGSVGTSFSNGTLTLFIQSDKSIWSEENRSWHIEAQFLRFINGHGSQRGKWDDALLFQNYKKKPPFFEIHEK